MKKYYIVRGNHSGIFAGNIERQEGQQVTMSNVRRLWYWEGANSISQIALEGVKKPNSCKFTVTVKELTLLDAIETIPCTREAEENIKAVPEWRK